MPRPSKKPISVTMPKGDWEIIRRVLWNVGGDPDGWRGAADRLDTQLVDLGVTRLRGRLDPKLRNIYFKP